MLTDILFNKEARNKMKKGVDTLADAVKVTLGPGGRNVAIRNERDGKPKITKDGVTVARTINLVDKFEDMGAQMVKMAAEKTAVMAGDGTTTSTLLAQVIIREGMSAVENGANPVEIKKGIDLAVSNVVKFLKDKSQSVNYETMAQVAAISANNNIEIGLLVAGTLKQVGPDGVVYLQPSKTADTFVEKVNGLQLDKGYISPYMCNNMNKMTVEFDDALILMVERKISTYMDIETALEIAIKNKKPLLIICEDIDGEALATVVANKTMKDRPFAAIKLPGYGNMQLHMLDDIAVVTGGTVVSEQRGHVLRQITPDFMGQAKHIVITSTTTSIVGGKGNKRVVSDRIEQVKSLIDNAPNEFEADKLQKQRLAKLTNGVAIIHVGATTDLEMSEKKDRVDDALRATRAAIEEGIVPGGGTAYIRAIQPLQLIEGANDDQNTGIRIVLRALEEPLRQIVLNAGKNADSIIKEVQENWANDDFGYNAKNERFEPLYETGVIDSTKVSRVALEHAASVGAMFLTTECAIIDIVPK